ncbi:hypothetical protein S40293_10554 [Stachybotrys chartarum IBT 40293]|nr:hypothetical protein S40293_10554 [Stachybotrys chartarum IBT 40293]KFA73855.1 hypothetical protein S40288_11447 [Stachybotrys chartarum IBT 40288]
MKPQHAFQAPPPEIKGILKYANPSPPISRSSSHNHQCYDGNTLGVRTRSSVDMMSPDLPRTAPSCADKIRKWTRAQYRDRTGNLSTTFRPLKPMRQAWEDYHKGRTDRRMKQREQFGENRAAEKDEEADMDEDQNIPGDGASLVSHPGWRYQGGEFPWTLEHEMRTFGTWRGSWRLEAKDIFDVVWERRKIYDGKRWRDETIPQWHYPCPRQAASNR